MNDELLTQVEREVSGWAGVLKKRNEERPGGIGVTIYRFRQWTIDYATDFR